MNDRKVTIFVTVYNIEKHLDRFFAYLKAQTYTDYEVLIIDDGSTDNSRAICEEHAKTDDRIRVISVDHIGISAARNLVLSKLDTPFATSLDGDDYFDKDYLKHLMDAQKKYNADLVLSNVILVYEDGTERNRFAPREEGFYEAKDFPRILPALLIEERMNYLYAKLYKTELLKNVRVEPDVMQGSDTMINFMYLKNARSIAITENYDYYYVQYQKRSVTSYTGADYFKRLYRINQFLLDKTEEYGWLNDEMLRVIDCRILHVGRNTLLRIAKSQDSKQNKYLRASDVTNSEEYLCSYHRLKNRDQLDSYRDRYNDDPIAPGEEKSYIDHVSSLEKETKMNDRLKQLRLKCPDPVFNIWHKLRTITGTERKD